MGILIDGEFIGWTTRITIKESVKDAVRLAARSEVRSTATMLGILLEEALSARSSAAQ